MRGGITLTPTQRKRLTKYREQAGLTRAEAARRSKLYAMTWTRVENGVDRPGHQVLKRMAAVVGLRCRIVLEDKPK